MSDTTVMGAAIVRAGRVLVTRRRLPEDLAGGWEFPGGKVEAGEAPDAAVVREVAEELGCEIAVTGQLSGAEQIRPGLVLRVAVAEIMAREPIPFEHDMVRWLAPEDLGSVRWLAPDLRFLPELRELLLDGQRLEGNVSGVVRIGTTVRRATGPWTAAVHELLQHVAARGVPCVPRVLGHDSRGREVLTFLRGVVVDVDSEALTEQQIVSVTRWVQTLHAAVSDFSSPGPWRMLPSERKPNEIICHNDVAPYNICFNGDVLAGVFDWDMAGPNTPLIDLGFLAWNAVPLWRDLSPAVCARRLDLIAQSYAGPSSEEILHATVSRVEQLVAGIKAGQAAGDEGMLNLGDTGEPARSEQALTELVDRIPSIVEELT